MDRFVWFVLLVVISHLATEFTRVSGYIGGSRQDAVTVNDSLMQPIKVQNQVLYPGQEYGLYVQQNQQYYSGSNHYSNYANNESYKNPNTNANKNNFLSSLFNQFVRGNNNGNDQEQSHMSNSVASNNLLNLPLGNQGDGKTFSLRPLIDSIFEIPISTLRAVNDLLGRLTGGYSYLQPQQQNPQPPTKYSFYPSYSTSITSNPYYGYYGMHRAAGATQPKSQFEILSQKQRPAAEATTAQTAANPTVTTTTPSLIPSHKTGPPIQNEIFKETPKNLLKQ